jgi:hypothetical protein
VIKGRDRKKKKNTKMETLFSLFLNYRRERETGGKNNITHTHII